MRIRASLEIVMRSRSTLAVLAVVFSVLLFPQGNVLAASPAWSSIAQLPEAIGNASAVTAPCEGNTSVQCLYSIGGVTESTNGLTTVDMFNASSNTWTAVAPLTTGRSQLGAASGPCTTNLSQTCIYAFGGADSTATYLNSVEVYSPYTNKWSAGPVLPTPGAPSNYLGRAQLAGASAPCFTNTSETCVYAVGGYNPALYTLGSVEMFNPATMTWSAAASLNVARSRPTAASAPCEGNITATCLYAVGGTGTSGFLGSVEMYNPSSNSWTQVAGLEAQGSTSSVQIAGLAATGAPCLNQASRSCLYAFGGQDENFNILKNAMMYDPNSNAWTYIPAMITARDNFGGSTAPCPQQPQASCLFALGGAGQTYTQAAESFNTGAPTPTLTITANNGAATYGGQVPTFTFKATGFVNGDTLASLTTQPTCTSTATQNGSGQDTSPVGGVSHNLRRCC
jgi:hypothetical protein